MEVQPSDAGPMRRARSVLTVRLSLAVISPAFAGTSSIGNGASRGESVMRILASYRVMAFAVAVGVVGLWSGISHADNPWGRPNGWHYNLELIAVPHEKTVDNTDSQGRRIFIKLSGNTKILLSPGPFQVLDFNGTDGQASFQLPANPCIDPTTGAVIDCPLSTPTFQCYSVWGYPNLLHQRTAARGCTAPGAVYPDDRRRARAAAVRGTDSTATARTVSTRTK